MSIASNIRKMLVVGVWLIIAAGIIVLLIAAVNSRSEQVCRGYEIRVGTDEKATMFINRDHIVDVITNNRKTSLKNQEINTIDLDKIESRLKREPWIKDAELFFDNKGILKVNVRERSPVARVFTTTGESFYIDSSCRKLPVSNKASARLPVFTGYPFSAKKAGKSERRLLNDIRELSIRLEENAFWMAQVSQVDITPSRQFEIIPTVGNHIIEFGDAKNADEKFRRLLIFYQQVLSKAGMEKYERVKVQYNNQVIGVKKGNN